MQRHITRGVSAGGVRIGGGAPVSVQSMTNTDTRDTAATIAQILELERAGCEIVRVSVFDEACARAIPAIHSAIHIPLVADIHFDHRLAIAAAENGVDKLRLNPGNIGGRQHVEKVVDCARMHHTPIRIGVNGGSLEADLRREYGPDSPQAMVESAMRHVRLLEAAHFFDIVISLKSSTVSTTVEAYRQMAKLVEYPLHIGITETGTPARGLIKSAAGLGALLLDGIGDTLRISLTDAPVEEVRAGVELLRALRLRRDDIEIISCPTCGRTRVDLMQAVKRVDAALPHGQGYLRVAVMGCAVNGPGEAADADIGIAFGSGSGVLFRRGERFAHGAAEDMIALLVREATAMLRQRREEEAR